MAPLPKISQSIATFQQIKFSTLENEAQEGVVISRKLRDDLMSVWEMVKERNFSGAQSGIQPVREKLQEVLKVTERVEDALLEIRSFTLRLLGNGDTSGIHFFFDRKTLYQRTHEIREYHSQISSSLSQITADESKSQNIYTCIKFLDKVKIIFNRILVNAEKWSHEVTMYQKAMNKLPASEKDIEGLKKRLLKDIGRPKT